MKFLLQIVAITVTGFLLGPFLPWYCFAILSFAFGYLINSPSNFLAGFVSAALLWGIMIWLLDSDAATSLGTRVAQILPLKEKSLLILVCVVLAGLIGGLACVSGALLRPQERQRRI